MKNQEAIKRQITMTKKQKDRIKRLMPNGLPKYIHVYDNKGKTADRYTVVYTRTGRSGNNRYKQKEYEGTHLHIMMSGNPCHPQGVCMHGESSHQIDYPSYSHLGKKIEFKDLPDNCKNLVLDDYKSIWKI